MGGRRNNIEWPIRGRSLITERGGGGGGLHNSRGGGGGGSVKSSFTPSKMGDGERKGFSNAKMSERGGGGGGGRRGAHDKYI